MTQSRVFGRVSELRSGSKREAPHDNLVSEDIHPRLYVGEGVFKRAGWVVGCPLTVADGWCDSLDLRSQTTSGEQQAREWPGRPTRRTRPLDD